MSGNATREMPHAAGLRATAAPYATPCTATSNAHVRPVGLEMEYVPRPFVVLAVRVLAHDVPASAPQPSCFDPLHLPCSAAQMSSSDRVEIQQDPVPFEARRRNQRASLSFLRSLLMINHQPSSDSSKLLGDENTSATTIWDPIISLHDTLHVSSNNLVHIRVSDDSKGGIFVIVRCLTSASIV